ncbi:MAG: RimK/LysX family protein [Acidobacteriota bacterium]|nr:RimK/LysX family protein [Acidobacteriota bacterium]MDH3528461.1 RimK/LysX family protein [Acidobacteriota bacterium]
MDKSKERKVMGRREVADFPLLGLECVRLKIDTGAYSSAIHCSSIELVNEGLLHVVFLHEDEEGFTGKAVDFNEFETRNVKSSSGHAETRYAINTRIVLGQKKYRIRMTLTDRSEMRYPVLIGRRFLRRNRFIVDPNKTDLIN